jgi:hypothetical protein
MTVADIHYIAEKFLRDYTSTQADTFTSAEVEYGPRQIILVRADTPQYFYGFKHATKKAVWTYDRNLAKTLDEKKASTWMDYFEKTAHPVLAVWNGVKE